MKEPQTIDLMTDLDAEHDIDPIMIVHIVLRSRGSFNVICGGRIAEGLSYDEMLGQIIGLFPSHRAVFGTRTRQELEAYIQARRSKDDHSI